MANIKGNPENFKNTKCRLKDLPAREKQEIASKGGKASQEVQREKRKLKESLEIALDIMTKRKLAEARKKGDKDEAELLEESGILTTEMIKIALQGEKEDTRLKAMNDISNRIEGKPVDKQQITSHNINEEIPTKESLKKLEDLLKD
jgi:hypothetical protein